MTVRTFFALLIISSFGSPVLLAQEFPSDTSILTGKVVDAETGTPLLGAYVSIAGEDWGTLSDEEGLFKLSDVPLGDVSILVEHLGYTPLLRSVSIGLDEKVLTLFEIVPDPIILRGIEVVSDRLERRFEGVLTSARSFDRGALLASGAPDMLEFVRSRGSLYPVPCRGSSNGEDCAVIQGRTQRIKVIVDEMPFSMGLGYLRLLRPHEVSRVEVLRGASQVRVYTESFMEAAERGLVVIRPIIW